MLIVSETPANSFLAAFFFLIVVTTIPWLRRHGRAKLHSLMAARDVKEVREEARTRCNHQGNTLQ